MYTLIIYEREMDNSVLVKFQSMQQVLDFLSLLNLSLNPDVWVQLSYERRAEKIYDET
jgi:hypothetical protein